MHGRSIPSLADAELFDLRKKFGVLFQDGALFGSMNLYDNVAFPLRQHTEKADEEIREIVTAAARGGSRTPRRRCPTSSRAECESAPDSPGRW